MTRCKLTSNGFGRGAGKRWQIATGGEEGAGSGFGEATETIAKASEIIIVEKSMCGDLGGSLPVVGHVLVAALAQFFSSSLILAICQ